ncbi:MAG: muconolactone Delta-isomerase family protein [Saprospiraceae bacterium]|jgi:muconolactone delta-isomerase|nr:muconolactone Delta-isomerase family protein [Saprospiraceae bacterium]
MDNHFVQYMVDFTMPQDLPDDFVHLIPEQRAAVNRLLNEGKILTYALSLENSKLWAVFCVQSEEELTELINRLPLSHYMKKRVSELTFYNAAHPFIPSFSMN